MHGALFACAVVTVLAGVRLLTGVYSQVRCQGALVTCAVSAVLANMLEHRCVQSIEGPARWTRSCQVCLALVGVSRCLVVVACTSGAVHCACTVQFKRLACLGVLTYVPVDHGRNQLQSIAAAEIVVLIAPPVVGETLSAQLGGTVLRRHRWLGGGLLKWRPATGGRLSGRIHFSPSVHVDVACL